MMLTGNNGILNRAGQAKEETEMAQLKEQAELVKLNLSIEKNTSQSGDLSVRELVNAIKNDHNFTGSKSKGNRITTKDKKYDIIISSDLGIKVYKHININDTDEYNGNIILLSLEEDEAESRVAILNVTATVDKDKKIEKEELISQIDSNQTGDTEELKRMFYNSCRSTGFVRNESKYTSYNDFYEELNTTNDPIAIAAFKEIKQLINYYKNIKAKYDWDYFVTASGMTEEQGKHLLKFLEKEENVEDIYDFILVNEGYESDIILKCSNGQTINVRPNAIGSIYGYETQNCFIIEKNETYSIEASNEEGDYGEEIIAITKCKEEIYSDILTATTTVTSLDGQNIPVPAGFAYGKDEKVGKLSSGFVITDKIDTKTHYSKGNEFVWIPIEKDTLKVVGTDYIMAREADGFDDNGNKNYEGVEYYFDGIQKAPEEDNNKEPAVLDIDKDYLGEIGLTEETFNKQMKEDYNLMIKSIQTYGGFYVARYEMGLENNMAISKLGVKPVSTNNQETYRWYGLYSKARTYSTNFVQSSMIWASQYDAITNFILKNVDFSNYNPYDNYTYDKTGVRKNDAIINILDTTCNYSEFTLGATFRRDRRVLRESLFASNVVANPVYPHEHDGTRITLYIK